MLAGPEMSHVAEAGGDCPMTAVGRHQQGLGMQGLDAGWGSLDHPGSNGNGRKGFKPGISLDRSFRMSLLKNEERMRPEAEPNQRAGAVTCAG